MAVAGALVVLIGLCLCLICVCWKRHASSKKKKIIASNPAVPLPDIQETVSDSQGTSGYGYEVIDESKLERQKPVIQHDYVSCKSSNNDSEVCGTDSDGYLHPYHSLVSNNSISSKSVKNNENIYEEKPYIELSTNKQCKNEEQQKENCELANNELVVKMEDEIKYDVPKNSKSIMTMSSSFK